MPIIGIPEIINDFNMYSQNNRLVGVTGSVAIPDFEGMAETISGAGILGEYGAVAIGRYSDIEWEIPFRCVDPDYFDLSDPSTPLFLTLRGAVQYNVKATGAADYTGIRIVVRGKPKTVSIGTIEQGKPTESKVVVIATYVYIELDGKPKFELDKINGVFKVNSKDLLSKIKSLT